MNATIAFGRPFFASDFSASPGTSSEAGSVRRHLQELHQAFVDAESLHGAATREMQDAFLDCREENWDGYDASPVSDTTFLRAREFLSQILPRFPAPTASAAPGGSLVFEWFVSPRRRFLASIGEDERVAFAGVFGSDPIHGTTTFNRDIPPEIIQHLVRLFLS